MKRPTISFITHNLTDTYGQVLLAGITHAVRDHDVNLLCFVGRDLNSPQRYDNQSNIIFQLAVQKRVDGIIFSGGVISNFTSKKQAEAFYDRYPAIPKVSIAVRLKNVSSVLIENDAAMKKLIIHLIEDHGRCKIAYITGPKDNIEVNQRFESYCEVLLSHQIPLNPDLVIEGNFEIESGFQAVQKLLGERKVEFDAVVAANDNMALGALEALHQRGISVPNAVAVCGFDDLYPSSIVTPPLTTIRQPFYEMARKAVEVVVDQIRKKPVPEEIVFPTELIIRESCGCFPFAQYSVTDKAEVPFSELARDDVLVSLKKELRKEFSSGELEKLGILIETLSHDLKDHSSTSFAGALNSMLQRTVIETGDLLSLQALITSFKKHGSRLCSSQAQVLRLFDLIDQARLLLAAADKRTALYKKSHQENETQIIQDVSEILMMTLNEKELTDVLKQEVLKLGIRSCYLSLYETLKIGKASNPPKPCRTSRMLMAIDDTRDFGLGKKGVRFQSAAIIPEKYRPPDRRVSVIILPLYLRTEHYGTVVFEAGSGISGAVYESLRSQISSALKGVRFYRELYSARKSIETHVRRLENSNQDLEEFAYATSHDLQEPLRMITTYSGLLQRRIEKTLDTDSKEFLFYITDSSKRMQTLINDLLIYSRVTTQARPFKKTDLKEVIDSSISDMKLSIDERKARITCDRLPTLTCDRNQMERVIQNLLGNAIKYCTGVPEVHISAQKKDHEWIISVKDNGIGIDPLYHEKIFGIFQRLHSRNQYSGTGIGLAICKKIIDHHGGHIWVDSQEGRGSTFHFTLPERPDQPDA